MDTSGITVNEKDDGTIELFFCDYDVEEFGGHDFECTYKFDKENSEKFRNALSQSFSGSLEEMVIAAFSKNFIVPFFYSFCKVNGITFEVSIWS